MHVIGHHDERIQNITVMIEMPQRVDYNFSQIRFFENALAVSLVEPVFATILKPFLVLIFRSQYPKVQDGIFAMSLILLSIAEECFAVQRQPIGTSRSTCASFCSQCGRLRRCLSDFTVRDPSGGIAAD